ncbi:MAG: hypothetical protein G3M70_07350 [Candidatus Nitronauta litoralis]|uniref:Uncharacterized protein n=1 Tax=Candidatus Nitronauta litoralis TaxID=2705533 RepID=A0A7T0G0C7_9BACT|nr:MAG: hypothetical protein G3M70_07350 [Candidatus Nitronauta litoralis]
MTQFRIQQDSPNPVTNIKREAGRRIVEVAGSITKQINLQARFSILQLKEMRGTITPPESAELDKIVNVWDWVQEMRDASKTLEVSKPADFKDKKHWPKPPAQAERPEKAQKKK